MKIEQPVWSPTGGWQPSLPGPPDADAQLVLVFGATDLLRRPRPLAQLAAAYPQAAVVGCSTSGEIHGDDVVDGSIVATAVDFAHTRIETAMVRLAAGGSSADVGRQLGRELRREDLVHVLVLSDGLLVNGSSLVRGLVEVLPPEVRATGGLAGDGERFQQTLVLWGREVYAGAVLAVGLYGSRLRVGYGSLGGWDPFGPERLITRSDGNVLYELDGRSALELHKKYLGPYAKDLPASALLFPLSIRTPDGENGVVRTILAIDEENQSMTFAGDVPEGHYARLMKANFDRLLDGATEAARTSYEAIGRRSPELAVLISCVGRKMVLKQRIEEEVEGVREVLGPETAFAGFYSYGEISPFNPAAKCELHNQTMTITTLREE